MDQGLRITVGNDMYYEGSQTRSRYDDRAEDSYRRRSPPREEMKPSWDTGGNWSRQPSQAVPHPEYYMQPGPEKYDSRQSPPRAYRSDTRHWSPSAQRQTYDPDVHRKYPENRRSPTSVRSRSMYRQPSPPMYRKGPHQEHRPRSISRSRSPSLNRRRSRSHSPSHANRSKAMPASDDLLSSMYSTGGSRGGGGSGYDYNQHHSRGALDELRESYDHENSGNRNSRHRKKEDSDDEEEAYLYGDDKMLNRHSKETPRKEYFSASSNASVAPRPVDSPPPERQAVTPGGFDTKALKNVLKAIGFDFELSAQSLQKAATSPKETSKSTESSFLSNMLLNNPVKPQSPLRPERIDQPSPKQVEVIYQTPFQQPTVQASSYMPSNVISGPASNYIYSPSAMPFTTGLPVQSTVPQQVIYQPSLPQTAIMPFMQTAEHASVSVPNRPNLKVIPTVSMKPLELDRTATIKSTKAIEEEKMAKKRRLDYLEVELRNLKKKQAELVRKKKKQFSNNDHEQIKQNSMLQAGVEKQIQEIREAAERAAGIRSSDESSDSDESSGSSSSSADEGDCTYVDPGTHFCNDCNVTCSNLSQFLNHLHTKAHKKLMDPQYKPWYKKVNIKTKPNGPTAAFKGSQFLLPIFGFYCKLCRAYSGDATAAEEHFQTRDHNIKYAKFCKKNPDYEKRKHTADLEQVANRIKRLKEDHKEEFGKMRKERASDGGVGGVKLKEDKERFRDEVKKEESRKADKYHGGEKSEKKFYSFDRKEPKYSNDRKEEKFVHEKKSRDSYYSKEEYSADSGYKKREPLDYHSKSTGYPEKYRDDDRSSRSSSRMPDVSPLRYKDAKSRDARLSYEKSKARASPPHRSPYARRGSPKYFEPRDTQSSTPSGAKRRYEEPTRKQAKVDKKSKVQNRWSPGYDAIEENRERDEVSGGFNAEKQRKPATSSFGKFTWKKTDKSRMKRNEPESGGGKPGEKVSMKLDAKGNTGTRILRPRSGLNDRVANFAPHTQIRSAHKAASPPPKKSWSNSSKSKNWPQQQTLPAPPEKPVEEQVKMANKKSFEPPPPGTEDIFDKDENGNLSDGSGISMEIGSDIEN